MKKLISFFSLFGSLGTLLCCALPVTLVSIGMGASFASFTASFPQIIWLTERKDLLFAITGALLALSWFMRYLGGQKACPIDIEQREACQDAKKASSVLTWISLSIYVVGFGFSYILPRL